MQERHFSNWRAVAHNFYGEEHLLYVGISFEQVKKNYSGSFYELLTHEEQANINRITVEKFIGAHDCGRWNTQDILKVPRVHKSTAAV